MLIIFVRGLLFILILLSTNRIAIENIQVEVNVQIVILKLEKNDITFAYLIT